MTDQPLKSPVADAMMDQISIMGVPVHKCVVSGGYWISQESLKTLAELQETPITEVHTGETLQQHRGRTSPVTNNPLMEFEFHNHSGIKLDMDPETGGIWLDQGELKQLMDYLDEDVEHQDAHEDHIKLSDRVMLFLYQLTAHPPMY